MEDKLRSLLHGVLRKRDRDRDICKKIFEENIYRAIVEGQYVKDNLLNDKIWRTIFKEQYLEDNILRSYMNNIWTMEFFLKDNIWEGQYFNIILDTGDTPIFFRLFSKNLEISQKNFYSPRFYFLEFLSKNLKFRNFFGNPQKKIFPPKKIFMLPQKKVRLSKIFWVDPQQFFGISKVWSRPSGSHTKGPLPSMQSSNTLQILRKK